MPALEHLDPRVYAKTMSVKQGGTLIACAQWDRGGSGKAEWRILKVTGFPSHALFVDPDPTDPLGDPLTPSPTPPPPPSVIDPLGRAPRSSFRDEFGYNRPELQFGIPANATPGLYAIQFRRPAEPAAPWNRGGTA